MTVVIRTFLHENSVHTGRTTPIFSLCLYFDVSNTPGKLHFTRCDVITVTKSVHRQSDTPVVVPATTGVFRTIFCHDDTHVHTHKDTNCDGVGASNDNKDGRNNVNNVKMNVSKCF